MLLLNDYKIFKEKEEEYGSRNPVFLKLIEKELQEKEDIIAKTNNRKPAKVIVKATKVKDGKEIKKSHYYNEQKHTIHIFYPNGLEFAELTSLIRHEAEHSNQYLSPLNSLRKKHMIDISKEFYPKGSGIRYHCNFIEIEAKLKEARALIRKYKNEKGNIDNINEGLMYMNAFKHTKLDLENVNKKDIRKLKLSNFVRLFLKDYKWNEIGMSKRDVLKFLLTDYNQIYKETVRELNIEKTKAEKIHKELQNKFGKNIFETEKTFQKQRELESLEKEYEIKKIITENDIVVVNNLKEIKNIKKCENTYTRDYEEFEEISKKLTKNGYTIYAVVDFNKDEYDIYYEKTDDALDFESDRYNDDENTKGKNKEKEEKFYEEEIDL